MGSIKYIKPLVVASIINIGLGGFLIVCGLLEFTNILDTPANTTIQSVGVQLSYLVFISGVLVFLSGGLTFINRRSMYNINLQIFLGVIALAWPIFVSIALFFAQLIICIRLMPTMLTSLFYIITLLIVKIANEALQRTHKFNPSAHINTMGKRKQNVNVAKALNAQVNKATPSVNINSVGALAEKMSAKRSSGPSLGRMLYSGTRRRRSGGLGSFLYSGSRRRGGGFGSFLYSGSRRRGKFRLRK